ncbi:Short chain dehydrogenase, putative [Penicillium digitatum]|uniref:Short chain dehydrogenase, putative n=3 Tax=Penicillium digitatum TaxID=36651 RepID=K9FKU7_PEND2|nr:Short chain dehydrogenase, putative [Penicillium digitatum Pd1]EKV08373.1 Short chain dehydrogenase, putative [Penicillium digitatum Pd1]EKV09859.1 Short chain dehydrogenase, putative [Penicillium digitatum PHI26]QQK41693.1 Short chain dehydrogenase, putative [Penicillium digitatum]
MPYSLSGRNVLITGGSRGLGALSAEKFASQGSNIAINYLSSKEIAERLASEIAIKYGVKAVAIQGDAGVKDDCINAVKTTVEKLGGLDVIISNAGWTKMTDFGDLDAMDDDDWDKCWSVNVKSSFYLFKAALPTFNVNPEGGVFLITASIAGAIPAGSSLPYAVSKAASIHLMKCLAKSQGAKIRVNAILPGLLLTEWGQGFSPDKIESWKNATTLKRAPEVEDCADMFVTLAKNASITGQTVQIDSGFGI